MMDDWEAQEPSPGFAERVLARALDASAGAEGRVAEDQAASARRRTRTVGVLALGLLGALAAMAVVWPGARPAPRGEATAEGREEVQVGDRARLVLERGARVVWSGDDVTQAAGDVFYRVEQGARFRVHTPAGDVEVAGTCFRVSLTGSEREKAEMNRRDVRSGSIGAALTGLALVAVYEGKVRVSRAGESLTLTAGQSAHASSDGVVRAPDQADVDPSESAPSDEPFAAANRSLVQSVREAQARLTAIEEEKTTLQARLASAEARLARASGEAGGGRARNEFDLTPGEWADLAKTGTVKFRLPCSNASEWTLSPGKLAKIGLAPDDAAVMQGAYAKSNQRVWSQVKPICAEALGSADVAEKLGRATCTHLILELTPKAGDDGDDVRRAVAEIRAGQRAMPAPGDDVPPLEKLLLVLTGENRLFEGDLAASLGPEEAHRVAFADGLCTESSSIGGGGHHDGP